MLRICSFILLVWLALHFIPCVKAQTSRLSVRAGTNCCPVYTQMLEENVRFRIELERRINAEMLRALGMTKAAEEYEEQMNDVQDLFFPNQKKGNENE